MSRLKDKVAIITGAAMGIGHTTALLFSQEGAKVVIADINTSAGQETAKKIKEKGGEAIFVLTDITRESDVKAMVKAAVKTYSKIDVLCNNAGLLDLSKDGPVTRVTEEIWDKMLAVNLKGAFFCCKYSIPEMIKAGGGSIINITSVAVILGRTGFDAYTAAKGGMHAITKSIAAEFVKEKIRCNEICPAATVTPMTEEALKDSKLKAHYMTPIGRLGIPEDTAYCAIYLASDGSSWVTGQTFILDGGQSTIG